jgi:hypothetical protein
VDDGERDNSCGKGKIKKGSVKMENTEQNTLQETFLARMIAEERTLTEKTEKALAFEKTETYEKLSQEEKELLGMQINAMTLYLYFLRERIFFYREKQS